MYLEHYGLTEPPFSITPDPRFVFLSERHREALAHLLFGIDKGGGGGFVQLTGEVGTGKTTLCRLLLEQLPENARAALVLNPRQSPVELLETTCEELHIDIEAKRGSTKSLVDALNTYLLEAYSQGLRVVLIIDEAQDLSIEALEQVRLLTNLETDTQKLLQVLLLGQPELRDMLDRDDLRQLAQRITARFHLTPLDAGETERYLRHRYAIAGGRHLPFDNTAIRRLHQRSGGVPRLINVIAERSLLAGYARDRTSIDAALVDAAARESLPAPRGIATARLQSRAAMILLGIVAIACVVAYAMRPAWTPANTAALAGTGNPTSPPHPQALPAASTVTVKPDTPSLDATTLDLFIAGGDAAALPAWQALLSQWNLPTATNDVAIAAQCAAVLAPGVYCLRAHGDLDMLAAIGRPALLRLYSDQHDGWVVLLGIDAKHARLRLGNYVYDVPRVVLQQAWQGEYAVLWRAPEAVVAPLAPGSGGPAAQWLQRHLQADRDAPAAATDAATTSSARTIDAATIADVRRFQLAHGLVPDGIIGPGTVFALSANDPGPHLLQDLH